MSKKRWQKNITLSEDQLRYLKDNFNKKCFRDISSFLGVTYNKLHNNARLLGMVKTRSCADKGTGDLFDEDNFFKNYK